MSDLPEPKVVVVEAPKTAKDRLIEKRDLHLTMVLYYAGKASENLTARDKEQQQADDLSEASVALGHVNKP